MSHAAVSTGRGWAAAGLLTAFTLSAVVGVSASLPLGTTAAVAVAVLGLAIMAAAAAGGRRAVLLTAVAVAALTGLVRGAAAVHHPGPGTLDGHLGRTPVVVSGTVRDSVAPGPAGTLVVDATRLGGADGAAPVEGGLLVPVRTPTAQPGDTVSVAARGLRPPGRRPGPRSEAALERLGVEALAVSARVTTVSPGGGSVAEAVRAVRSRIVAAVDAALPEPAATLLLGIAFGLRRPLDAGLTTALQDAGLFHIVVVSGLKVIIVAGMVRAVAGVRGWSGRQHGIAAVTTVGGYVLLSGAGVAAVRSAVMAGIALGLRRDGRRADPLPLLALVAAIMMAVDPHLWTDVGFQLSFLGTAGILLLAGRIADRLPGPRLFAEPFAVTVAAQLATLPVMAGTFGVVSLAGPMANALVLPLLPLLIVLGVLGAASGMVVPAAGWLLLHVAEAGIDGIVAVARLTAAVPGSAIHVGEWPAAWTVAELAGAVGVLAAILPEGWRRRRRDPDRATGSGSRVRMVAAAATSGILCAAGVLLLAGRPDGHLRLIVLDTGAATAVVVRTGDGGLALVDGGSDPAALTTALGRALSPLDREVDLVVMTGGDRTSVAGLLGLPGRYRVKRVAAPAALGAGGSSVLEALRRSGAAVELLDDRGWSWSRATWRCLPLGATRDGGPACALRVAAGDGSALVLGGAPVPDQEELAALYGHGLSSDLLVSAPGIPPAPALLDAVHPAQLAEPSARVTRAPPAGQERAALTGVDGDLEYTGGNGRLMRA